MRPVVVATVLLLAAGCGRSGAGDGSRGDTTYRLPQLPAPASFAATVDNPYFPLPRGATWVYRMHTDEGVEEDTVHVTGRTRDVAGVQAAVVHDRVRLDGRLIEDTWDWYAQDSRGNVWYLGEDTTAFEKGKRSTEGSWETGKHGARAGLIMPARPRVGDRYQQEYLKGVAEDRGEVVSTSADGKVPWGSFRDAVRTLDTTPLEPKLKEYKYYARGVGVVLEEEEGARLELMRFTR